MPAASVMSLNDGIMGRALAAPYFIHLSERMVCQACLGKRMTSGFYMYTCPITQSNEDLQNSRHLSLNLIAFNSSRCAYFNKLSYGLGKYCNNDGKPELGAFGQTRTILDIVGIRFEVRWHNRLVQ